VVLTEKRGHKKHAPVFQQHTLVLPQFKIESLVHLKIESLVHDHKYRGAPKDGHRGKEETIVADLKEGAVVDLPRVGVKRSLVFDLKLASYWLRETESQADRFAPH